MQYNALNLDESKQNVDRLSNDVNLPTSKAHVDTNFNNTGAEIGECEDWMVENDNMSIENACFEMLLRKAMKVLNVSHPTYQLTNDKSSYLVTFCVEASNVEASLICLQDHWIGNTEYTSISVIPASIHISCPKSLTKADIENRFVFCMCLILSNYKQN